MKCPQCGQWNRASLPRCARCGAALTPDASAQPAWKEKLRDEGKSYIAVDEEGQVDVTEDSRDELAREMVELKQRKQAGSRRQRQLRQESAQRGSAPSGMTIRTNARVDTFWNVEDNPEATVRPREDRAEEPEPRSAARRLPPRSRGGSRVTIVTDPAPDGPSSARPTRVRRLDTSMGGAWEPGRAYDPLAPEQEFYDSYRRPEDIPMPRKLPSRSRGQRHLVRFLTVTLIVGLIGLCGFFGFSYWQQRQAMRQEASRASVTASIKDDLAAHTILIPGEDGQQIYIRELHTSYVVTGGFATIEVPDHLFYDDNADYLDTTLSVTLTPFVKTSGGQQRPLDPVSYEITIPQSPIQLVSPDAPRLEVSTAMYSLIFNVRPGSTVFINGEDVSDAVNSETGELTYNATVQPIGDNTFVVRCRSQYCQESQMTVTLYRATQEIPLDLEPFTYTSTSESAVEISATTLPGATVEVLSPHSDLNITKVDTTGEFSFYAVFDHIGYNTIVITASYPGKKMSTVEYEMYYVPTPEIYTPKAWPLHAEGYAELLANITFRAERSQVYLVEGTVAYKVSDKPQMVVINTSADGKSQPVMVENMSKTTWKPDTPYRIYADVYGSYNGMPWLIARYTYPKK